jgi:DNA-directed RNA polymerase II subunit RPB1
MGTGAFKVCLDVEMLKDVIVNYRMPVQAMMQAALDPTGSKTPLGMMTPYDSNSPMSNYDYTIQGNAAFSPLAQAHDDFNDYLGNSTPMGMTPMRAGMGLASPGGGIGFSPVSPMVGYSPASPAYATSPNMTSPFVRYGATSPNIGLGATSPAFITSPSYSSV